MMNCTEYGRGIVVANFKVLSRYLHGETEETTRNFGQMRSEASTANECTKIFSRNQVRQYSMKNRRFGDLPFFHYKFRGEERPISSRYLSMFPCAGLPYRCTRQLEGEVIILNYPPSSSCIAPCRLTW